MSEDLCTFPDKFSIRRVMHVTGYIKDSSIILDLWKEQIRKQEMPQMIALEDNVITILCCSGLHPGNSRIVIQRVYCGILQSFGKISDRNQ